MKDVYNETYKSVSVSYFWETFCDYLSGQKNVHSFSTS